MSLQADQIVRCIFTELYILVQLYQKKKKTEYLTIYGGTKRFVYYLNRIGAPGEQ